MRAGCEIWGLYVRDARGVFNCVHDSVCVCVCVGGCKSTGPVSLE